MGYQQALEKAWNAADNLPKGGKPVAVKFLSDNYTVDLTKRTVFSDSCNVPAKDYVAILLLHYLTRKLGTKPMPGLTGEWIDFNALEGGEGYYPAFKKRTIDRLVKKYGANPDSIKSAIARIPGEKAQKGDAGIVIHPLSEISILLTISKADEEFGPDANILFDKNISDIFCTEDIVVLTEMVVHQL